MAALAGLAPHCATAETVEEAAALFGARESVLDVSLSPSGNKLVYITPGNPAGEAVYVVDLGGDRRRAAADTASSDPDSKLVDCLWATDDRLVWRVRYVDTVNDVLLSATRLFAMDADGSDAIMLSARDRANALGMRQDGGSLIALDLPGKPGKILHDPPMGSRILDRNPARQQRRRARGRGGRRRQRPPSPGGGAQRSQRGIRRRRQGRDTAAGSPDRTTRTAI